MDTFGFTLCFCSLVNVLMANRGLLLLAIAGVSKEVQSTFEDVSVSACLYVDRYINMIASQRCKTAVMKLYRFVTDMSGDRR